MIRTQCFHFWDPDLIPAQGTKIYKLCVKKKSYITYYFIGYGHALEWKANMFTVCVNHSVMTNSLRLLGL